MNPFHYERAESADAAVRLAQGRAASRYLGGGTNLVDLMRETVERPETVIDVSGLGREIALDGDGSVGDAADGRAPVLRIGAAASNTALASDRAVRTRLPVLSRAILAGASGQIRNVATVGGNLLQRTRCTYFYDLASRCNKRTPGSGCDAIDGFNRIHAILGASPDCVATHPSDMAVAMAALDASVVVSGPEGERRIALCDLHRLPAGRPDLETILVPGELIVSVEIEALPWFARSTYRKVRDRSSYAFALVSVAAALDLDADRPVRDVRIALGGVAHKPWRARRAEAALIGGKASEEAFAAAASAELEDAAGLAHNGFKIELARRTIAAVLGELAGLDEAVGPGGTAGLGETAGAAGGFGEARA